MIAAVAAAVLLAACTRDTTPQPRSLFGFLPIKALHLDDGGGYAPVQGKLGEINEFRLALAFCQWPNVTFVTGGMVHTKPTISENVDVGSGRFDRYLYTSTFGWEIQRRWRDSAMVRPILSFAFGKLFADNQYSPRSGPSLSHNEPLVVTSYYTPAVGAEISIFKYMTFYSLAGRRYAGQPKTSGGDVEDFSGAYFALGFGFGRFQ